MCVPTKRIHAYSKAFMSVQGKCIIISTVFPELTALG